MLRRKNCSITNGHFLTGQSRTALMLLPTRALFIAFMHLWSFVLAGQSQLFTFRVSIALDAMIHARSNCDLHFLPHTIINRSRISQ